jgi:hypothetical protein
MLKTSAMHTSGCFINVCEGISWDNWYVGLPMRGKKHPWVWVTPSTAWDPHWIKVEKEGSLPVHKLHSLQASFANKYCGCHHPSDPSFFSLSNWTHTSSSPGSFQAFNLRLWLSHWPFLFWTIQLLVLSSYWVHWPSRTQRATLGFCSLQTNQSPFIIISPSMWSISISVSICLYITCTSRES